MKLARGWRDTFHRWRRRGKSVVVGGEVYNDGLEIGKKLERHCRDRRTERLFVRVLRVCRCRR